MNKNKITQDQAKLRTELSIELCKMLTKKQMKKVNEATAMAAFCIGNLERNKFLNITSNKKALDLFDRIKAMSSTELVEVVFVVFKGEILALFPNISWNNFDPNLIQSYQKIGQHGAASKSLLKCKKATPEQYNSLFEELNSIYKNDCNLYTTQN